MAATMHPRKVKREADIPAIRDHEYEIPEVKEIPYVMTATTEEVDDFISKIESRLA